MYRLKEDAQEIFGRIRNQYYSECLGITPKYVGDILKGFKCAEINARALISVCFKIDLDEKQKINEMLEQYFVKEK